VVCFSHRSITENQKYLVRIFKLYFLFTEGNNVMVSLKNLLNCISPQEHKMRKSKLKKPIQHSWSRFVQMFKNFLRYSFHLWFSHAFNSIQISFEHCSLWFNSTILYDFVHFPCRKSKSMFTVTLGLQFNSLYPECIDIQRLLRNYRSIFSLNLNYKFHICKQLSRMNVYFFNIILSNVL
jgi:hypothetical protein